MFVLSKGMLQMTQFTSYSTDGFTFIVMVKCRSEALELQSQTVRIQVFALDLLFINLLSF